MSLQRNPFIGSFKTSVILTSLLMALGSCGPKDSVEDNETPTGPVKGDTRTRLVGGSQNSSNSTVSFCRLPLDLGTVVDPRRPGLMQTVLTTQIDTRCANYPEVRITVRTRQRLTLVGKFVCRSGTQFNEQLCTGNAQDILSQQKNSVTVPVVADESWRPSDVEASIEFM